MPNAVWRQNAFQRVADDGGVNAGTLLETLNGDWTQDVDAVFRVRFLIQQTNGSKAVSNQVFEIWYTYDGGAATQVTTTATHVQLVNDTQTIADHATTTQRIGSGTFFVGDSQGWNDGQTDDDTGPNDSAGGDEGEVECCLQIIGSAVVDAKAITVYVRTVVPADLDFYDNTPIITTNKEAGGLSIPIAMHHYKQLNGSN